jgi:hypothetical protein
MIRCKKTVTVKKLGKKGCPQGRIVCKKRPEPCKTMHRSRLKPASMSNKVRKIVEQRILTNLAISRARASVRAAKREKARRDAEQVNVELEKETALSEPDNPKSSKGSRRPPNPLVVYKNYLEKCKAASHNKIKLYCHDSASQNLTYVPQEPGPSFVSDQPSVTFAGQSLKYRQDANARKVSAGKVMSDDSCSKWGSAGAAECALRMKDHSKKNRETDGSEDCNQIDQPGTSKESRLNDNVFKKPFPVKLNSVRCKTTVKEAHKEKVKARNGRCQAVKTVIAAGRKSPVSKCLHPSVIENQRGSVSEMMTLVSQKTKPDVRKRRLGKTADLLKTLHDIVQLICEQVNCTLRY